MMISRTEMGISPDFVITIVKVAADWASDSASDWAAEWAPDSTHFNRSKVHFKKYYFQSFLTYFSLQISVDLSNRTYLFIAERKLRKKCSFVREIRHQRHCILCLNFTQLNN